MAINTHTVKTTYQSEGGSVTVKTESVNGDYSLNIEQDIPAGETNVHFDNLAVSVANLKGVAFGVRKKSTTPTQPASSVATLTVKTNSSTSPDDTISLTVSNGYAWTTNDLNPLLLTVDITDLYITSTGDAIAEFFGRFLQDSTPILPG